MVRENNYFTLLEKIFLVGECVLGMFETSKAIQPSGNNKKTTWKQ